MYPPPRIGKVEAAQGDILVVADVPPPNDKVKFWFWQMYPPPPVLEKLKSEFNVTFWFWLMYSPPP